MILVAEHPGIHGHYRITRADPSRAVREYEDILETMKTYERIKQRMPHALLQALLNKYHTAANAVVHEVTNLIPTAGRSVLAQRLAGTTTYSGTVNYMAVGSGTAAPANGDTTLGSEAYRQTLSSSTYTNHVAYLSCFIAAGDATGTHTEAGLFIDGTGSADTGQLFSHVKFSAAIVKGALNTLTLDATLTFT